MIKVRVAVILRDGDKILLAKHSKGGKSYWVLPGGGVEEGESLQDAAVREIKEEANLDIRIKKLVFVSEAIPSDKRRHVIDFFFAGDTVSGEVRKGEDRILRDIKFFPISAIDEIVFHPDIREEMKEALKSNFSGAVKFLGNRWQ